MKLALYNGNKPQHYVIKPQHNENYKHIRSGGG